MGLSSLLSKDDELAAVIKNKIHTKFKGKSIQRPSLIKNSIKRRQNNNSKMEVKAKDSSTQSILPIQNLVSGKFQPRKSFDLTELEELAESIKANKISFSQF